MEPCWATIDRRRHADAASVPLHRIHRSMR
jgi:hypothetical protein